MKIAELSVKHYQFTVLMFAMLVVLGITSWLSIPRGEDPTFPAPNYTVIAVYPGANPSDLEQLVVDKIEERLNVLENLKDMNAGLIAGSPPGSWSAPTGQRVRSGWRCGRRRHMAASSVGHSSGCRATPPDR